MYNQDGSLVEKAGDSRPTRQTQVSDANDEEESKGPSLELERGQIQRVNPDTDSILNSEGEQSQQSFAAAAGGGEEEKKDDDGLPQVEETKEVPKNRRKAIISVTEETKGSTMSDSVVTDDSFRNANLSLMPEDSGTAKNAATMPEMKVKAVIQPNLKLISRPIGRVQSNL